MSHWLGRPDGIVVLISANAEWTAVKEQVRPRHIKRTPYGEFFTHGVEEEAEAIRSYTTDIDLSWLDDSFPIEVRRVPLVSGDRDLVPSQVSELVDRFGAVAGDWESGAIAWVAHRHNIPLLIIRAVSDLVNEERGETIGALALFEAEVRKVMRLLVEDLSGLVPYVLARRRVVDTT